MITRIRALGHRAHARMVALLEAAEEGLPCPECEGRGVITTEGGGAAYCPVCQVGDQDA